MGLDMRPMGKPKPGFEERFLEIYRIIKGIDKQHISFIDRLKGKRLPTNDELLNEFYNNIITTYETVKAPKIGRDKEANDWARNLYEKTDKEISFEEYLNNYGEFYVLDLAKELDGIPVYCSIGQDENVFRGQFLKDCIDLIGENLVNEAWESKLADETLDYGNRLMQAADIIAQKHNLQHLKSQRLPPEDTDETLDSKLHVIYSLAKWLIFYGKNGHGYDADF